MGTILESVLLIDQFGSNHDQVNVEILILTVHMFKHDCLEKNAFYFIKNIIALASYC